METVKHALEAFLGLIMLLGGLIVDAIVAVEVWLRAQLALLGAPPQVQTAVLIVVAVLLILAAFRLFGGLIRIAVVIILLLIAIHALLPVVQP
jgi:hypothetical protein